MALIIRALGDVLEHIYDFSPGAAIFVPEVESYAADTPCVVGGDGDDPELFRQLCLDEGFKKWFNVAVVSDTCDEVTENTIPLLIAAFNEDCKEGGWLRENMNYWHGEASQ